MIRAEEEGASWMKRVLITVAALALGAPAIAGSYRVVLQPVNGKIIVGHAGVQAVDETTAGAHVRLISPGNEVNQRGTIRVLVRNLGSKPFQFGPDDVRLQLADGTELKPTSLDKFEKGARLVQREMGHAAAVDMQVKNSMSQLIGQTGGGSSLEGRPGGATLGSEPAVSTTEHNRKTEELMLPGGKTQDALYQLLLPETVGPKQAWGGYYVFDVPKAVLGRKADQPLTVIVRTGGEEHRFAATLHWK
jgi:hypothetical protein